MEKIKNDLKFKLGPHPSADNPLVKLNCNETNNNQSIFADDCSISETDKKPSQEKLTEAKTIITLNSKPYNSQKVKNIESRTSQPNYNYFPSSTLLQTRFNSFRNSSVKSLKKTMGTKPKIKVNKETKKLIMSNIKSNQLTEKTKKITLNFPNGSKKIFIKSPNVINNTKDKSRKAIKSLYRPSPSIGSTNTENKNNSIKSLMFKTRHQSYKSIDKPHLIVINLYNLDKILNDYNNKIFKNKVTKMKEIPMAYKSKETMYENIIYYHT